MARGILEVQLIDAKGLHDTAFLGKMDPYVMIQYRNQEQKSSVAKDQGTNPSWNETFKFNVQNAGAADHHQKLVLRIMDKDIFNADDFVGQATINVADVISLGVEKGNGELHPSKYSVVLADRTYCGEIRVGVKFTLKMEEEIAEEFGGWKHSFGH
ncbi:putative Ca2+-dependent phospholipid-binding protein [Dioscorea alata]|uniref:Ca2+-dependent phospholipid-binding protein n=1 Tax=Dioscorea alata TaxID=55571 RepID=A0ACB7U9J8_DIOAL|nr:putative Ca2+-dependent phospholipid-binding protein [Dioscorea alata]